MGDFLKKQYDECDKAKEAVNHPAHYNREGAMECIEEMILLFGVAETKSFCKLNAWKYRYRANEKGGAEDIRKSDFYISAYKELCERDYSDRDYTPF